MFKIWKVSYLVQHFKNSLSALHPHRVIHSKLHRLFFLFWSKRRRRGPASVTDKIDQRRNSQLQKANSPVHWICTNFPHILSIVLLFFCLYDILLNIRVWNPNPCQFLSLTFFCMRTVLPTMQYIVCTESFQNDWLCLCCGFLKVLSDDYPGSLNNFVLRGELRICQPQNNV